MCRGFPDTAWGESRDGSLEESTCGEGRERRCGGACWGAGEGQAGHWRRIPQRRDQQEVNCVPSRKELLMSAVPVVHSPCVGAGD